MKESKLWRIVALVVVCLASTLVIAQSSDPLEAVQEGTFTVRPSEFTGNPGFSNPALAYDGNLTTAAVGTATQTLKGASSKIETWFGFPSAPPGASGMQLNINSSAQNGRGGVVIVSYSLNGGTTFTTLYTQLTGTHGQTTSSVSLSNSQDLTQVRVKAQATAITDGTFVSTASSSIYEIWISGND